MQVDHAAPLKPAIVIVGLMIVVAADGAFARGDDGGAGKRRIDQVADLAPLIDERLPDRNNRIH